MMGCSEVNTRWRLLAVRVKLKLSIICLTSVQLWQNVSKMNFTKAVFGCISCEISSLLISSKL